MIQNMLKKYAMVLVLTCAALLFSGASYDYDSRTSPETGVLTGGQNMPDSVITNSVAGAVPAVYQETGEFLIYVVYPSTENADVNRDILAFVSKAVDDFKLVPGAHSFEMSYSAYAINRDMTSFMVDIRAKDVNGQTIYNRTTGIAYNLLDAKRLELSDVFGDYDFPGKGYGVEREYTAFALDADNLYLFLAPESSYSTVFTVPLAEFSGTLGVTVAAAAGKESYSVDSFTVGSAEDVLYPIEASMAPGWRKVDTVLDMFTDKEVPPMEDTRKYVALTFDDGPDRATTTRILDFLAEYGAKATFFVMGSKVSASPDLIKRMYDEGHAIGNHSYNHKQFTAISTDQMHYQILETNKLIEEITGKQVNMLRPPYGSMNANVTEFAKSLDMAVITWDIDPRDWINFNARELSEHIISRADDGSIIIMHDVYPSTAVAAIDVVKTLTEKNFVFVTVEELLNMNEGLLPGITYRNGKSAVR